MAHDRRGFLKRAGTGIAGITALSGCVRIPGVGGGGTNTITIGHQADETGALSINGFWNDRVIKNYAAKMNENGGIAGKDVEVVTANTESSPKVGTEAMRRLAQEDDADFVISSISSGVSIGSAPLAKEFDTPYFCMAQSPSLTGGDGNRWLIRPNQELAHYTSVGVPWGVENLGKNWTVMYQNYAFGQQFLGSVKKDIKETNGQVISEIAVPLGTSDLTSYLNQVPSNTDVLFNALVPPSSFAFLDQTSQLNTPGLRYGGLPGIEGVGDVGKFGKPANGAAYISYLPPIYAHDTKGHRELLEVANVEGTDKPWAWVTYQAYEAMSWIKRAVEKSGWSSQDDNKSFIEWFEQGPSVSAGTRFPQGDKFIRGQDHQAFVPMWIQRIKQQKFNIVNKFNSETIESNVKPRVNFTEQTW